MTFKELNELVIEIQNRIFCTTPSTDDQRIRYEHEFQQLLAEHGWTLSEYLYESEKWCKRLEEDFLKKARDHLKNKKDIYND